MAAREIETATTIPVLLPNRQTEVPLTRAEFEQALGDAGLTDVEIIETHRVHEHAAAVVVSASGKRLFLEYNGDALHTNVAEYIFGDLD